MAWKLSKAWWGVLCASHCNKSCKCKNEITFPQGLKSPIDLSSKRLSSNPICSRTDINISTGTTHTPVFQQSLQDFLHYIKIFDISAIFPTSPPSGMKTKSVKLGRRKKENITKKKTQPKNTRKTHNPPHPQKSPNQPTNPTTQDGRIPEEFKPPLQNSHGMTIKGRGVSVHIIQCVSVSQKMRLDKKVLIKVFCFTLQVSDPNTFKLLLPDSAVILPSYELIITILCLGIYWNILWHLLSTLPAESPYPSPPSSLLVVRHCSPLSAGLREVAKWN